MLDVSGSIRFIVLLLLMLLLLLHPQASLPYASTDLSYSVILGLMDSLRRRVKERKRLMLLVKHDQSPASSPEGITEEGYQRSQHAGGITVPGGTPIDFWQVMGL